MLKASNFPAIQAVQGDCEIAYEGASSFKSGDKSFNHMTLWSW